jgi:hypothetical protein
MSTEKGRGKRKTSDDELDDQRNIKKPLAVASTGRAVKENKPVSQEQRKAAIQNLKKLSQERQALIQQENELRDKIKGSRGGAPKGPVDPQQIAKIQKRLAEINTEFTRLEQTAEVSLVSAEVANMTHEHSLSISKFAAANSVIVVWRPINKEAAGKLGRAVNPYKGKGLNTKGKSSEFGPIAGDIPSDAALSKVAVADPGHIKEFRAKNQQALEQGKKEIAKIEGRVTIEDYEKINDYYLVCDIPKRVEINGVEHEVYYVQDAKDNVVWNAQKTSPQFVIKDQTKPDTWFAYNADSKPAGFDKDVPISTATLGGRPEVVKIMAYRQYKIENGQPTPYEAPITADYDELVSAPRRIFPFHQNQQIPTEFKATFFRQLGKPEVKLTAMDVAAEFLYEYESRLLQEQRNARFHSTMGNVTALQLVTKTSMKLDTGGATNHGPEVNNPFPEKFVEGDYAVHLTDGSVITLHSEQEICDFINKQRQQGFPLDVNPKWGWDIDDSTGELSVPTIRRFDWPQVTENSIFEEDKLKKLKKDLGILDNEHNSKILLEVAERKLEPRQGENPEPPPGWHLQLQRPTNALPFTDEQIEFLRQRLARQEKKFRMGENIIKTQVAIEKWSLEPDIIYSSYINNEEVLPTEQPTDSNFREVVAAKVKEIGKKFRFAQRKELQDGLKEQEEMYEHYFREEPFFTSHKAKLKKQREANQNQPSSQISSSSSSFFGSQQNTAAPLSQSRPLGVMVSPTSSGSGLYSSINSEIISTTSSSLSSSSNSSLFSKK